VSAVAKQFVETEECSSRNSGSPIFDLPAVSAIEPNLAIASEALTSEEADAVSGAIEFLSILIGFYHELIVAGVTGVSDKYAGSCSIPLN